MRYTRFEFRDGYAVKLKKFLMSIFLLIPAIAVIAGLFISKILIIPYLSKPEDKQDTTNYKYVDIKERKYYIAQAGVYSSKDNAESITEQVRSDNLPAFINQEEQYYRIIAFACMDYDFANNEIERYKSAGYNCIIKKLDITPTPLSEILRSEEKYILLSNVIDSIGNEIDLTCSLLSQYAKKTIDYNSICKELKAASTKTLKNLKAFSDIEDKGIDQLSEIISYCQAVDDIINEIVNLEDDSKFYCMSQERFVEALYTYGKIIEEYNKIL